MAITIEQYKCLCENCQNYFEIRVEVNKKLKEKFPNFNPKQLFEEPNKEIIAYYYKVREEFYKNCLRIYREDGASYTICKECLEKWLAKLN